MCNEDGYTVAQNNSNQKRHFFQTCFATYKSQANLEGYVIFFILSVAFIDKQQESDDNVGSN